MEGREYQGGGKNTEGGHEELETDRMAVGAQSRRSKQESREELGSCCYLHKLLNERRDCAIYSCVSLMATITDRKTSAKVLRQESAWKIQGMVRRLLKLERQKVIIMGDEFEKGLGGQGLTTSCEQR